MLSSRTFGDILWNYDLSLFTAFWMVVNEWFDAPYEVINFVEIKWKFTVNCFCFYEMLWFIEEK